MYKFVCCKFILLNNYILFPTWYRAVFEPRADNLPVHVIDPLETVGLQPTSDGNESKKVTYQLHSRILSVLLEIVEYKLFLLYTYYRRE